MIGVDFSAAMLQIGNEKIRRAGRVSPAAPAIDLIRGDATRIPLRDAVVDATTIGFGIRNVEQPGVACREIARVLRPGGTLVILEFSLPRSPALRNFYLWYFRKILPLIGRVISKHPSAYNYLPESVEAFPVARRVFATAAGLGFWHRACSLPHLRHRLYVRRRQGPPQRPDAIID